MRRCSLYIKLALLVCAAIVIVSAIPSSLAYIMANSNTLRNDFRVVYLSAQDISVPVVIRKTMIGMDSGQMNPGGFTFQLTNTDTGETAEAVSSDDGRAAMELRFTAQDAGRTYRYRLCELNTGRGNVIYDETVYEISVTLSLNEIHELHAELAMDGRPVTQIVAEYENRYDVPAILPDSGDSAQPALWLAMLTLSAAGLVALRKKRTAFRRQR